MAAMAEQDAANKRAVRLRPLWYAPIFNALCWLALLLVWAGIVRLVTPVPGQWPTTPWAIVTAGLLPFALHLHAARSPSTFLELSRTGLRRSVWGRARLLRWAEIERFRVLSHPRGPTWVVAELRAARFARTDDPLGGTVTYVPGRPERVRVDGKWTVFLFGGLTTYSLRDALEAWRAWAASGAGPPPVPTPSPDELVDLWIFVGVILGVAVCLLTAVAFAIGSRVGGVSIIGSLMCFTIFSLLVAVPTFLALGMARIRAHTLAWWIVWITFAVATSWAGHLAVVALRALRAAGT